MANHYDVRGPLIRRFRGDTYAETLTVIDSVGDPIDLTGASAAFTVRFHTYDETPVITKSSGEPTEMLVAHPTVGDITVLFDAEDTASLEPGAYVYDLEVTYVDGTVQTVAEDAFILDPDVTR